jgi:hypothetical protein
MLDTKEANRQIVAKIAAASISWVDVCPASQVVTVLRDRCLLHAGPPLGDNRPCSAMRNAILGAMVYERWAGDLVDAAQIPDRGRIRLDSAHDYGTLGPMAGIVSPSMPVLVLKNTASGDSAYVTVNEGLGKTLRFGANDDSVIERLRWIAQRLAPMLKESLVLRGPIDISSIISRAVQRGDECHNRNKAATSLLFRELAPRMVRSSFAKDEIGEELDFIAGNDHFFLNLSMAASKATMAAVEHIAAGSVVTCMASNGVQFGVRVSATGRRWYLSPAGRAKGNYFSRFTENDANPVMGDSYISETVGLGGFAMAASPNIARFIGGTPDEAIQSTNKMYRITIAEHPVFKIPSLGFRKTPLGIDVRAVVRTGIAPILNTGISHFKPGVGQIGAGTYSPPIECFKEAASALARAGKEELQPSSTG